MSLQAKFNNTLNDVAYDSDHSIMSTDAFDSESHFDLLGNLNQYGQYTFWKQLNFLLERFDKKKVELTPICRKTPTSFRNGSSDRNQHS